MVICVMHGLSNWLYPSSARSIPPTYSSVASLDLLLAAVTQSNSTLLAGSKYWDKAVVERCAVGRTYRKRKREERREKREERREKREERREKREERREKREERREKRERNHWWSRVHENDT
jgi:hypothetical protein